MSVHDGFKTATICLAVFSILLIAALVVVAIEFSTASKLPCFNANIVKPTSGSVKLEYSCPVQQPDASTFATLASYEDVQNAYNISELPDDYYWISKPAGKPTKGGCSSFLLLKKNGTFTCGDDNFPGKARLLTVKQPCL